MQEPTVHPDDNHLLGDWLLFGPRNEEIFKLVEALAKRGLRVEEIEAFIEAALRQKLIELDQTSYGSEDEQ